MYVPKGLLISLGSALWGALVATLITLGAETGRKGWWVGLVVLVYFTAMVAFLAWCE